MASNPAPDRSPPAPDRSPPAPADPGAARAAVRPRDPGTSGAPGCEWVVEARGCDPDALADLETLETLFGLIVEEVRLNEVRPALWHVFPGAGGVTGMSLLAESHLTCHTFPEHGSLCLNLFCCRPRPEWAFQERLAELVGARRVDVRRLERRYVQEPADAR